MNKDVDQVAATGGEKDGEESKSCAGNAAEKMNEPAANETVTQEVGSIGMQGKGGYQTPPFSHLKYTLTVSLTLYKPEGVVFPRAGYGEKED